MDNFGKVLKEVKNFPLNGLVKSTYGFDIKTLYTDARCTKPLKLNTFKVNSQYSTIFVKESPVVKKCKVSFNANKGTTIKAVTVKANSKLTKPKSPTRKGYKFVAWYKDSKCTKTWSFSASKVTANTTLYARWKKN